jgi:hypothetical protein
MVRDAAAICLPFSQVGRFVLGARAVTLHGVSAPLATITTVVDATEEFVAEILFLTVGLMIVLAHGQGLGATTPIALALGAALIAGVIATRVQHGATSLFVWFGLSVLGQWVAAGSDGDRAGFIVALKGRCQPMRGFKSSASAAGFSRSYDELRNFLHPRSNRNQHVPANHHQLHVVSRSLTAISILMAA